MFHGETIFVVHPLAVLTLCFQRRARDLWWSIWTSVKAALFLGFFGYFRSVSISITDLPHMKWGNCLKLMIQCYISISWLAFATLQGSVSSLNGVEVGMYMFDFWKPFVDWRVPLKNLITKNGFTAFKCQCSGHSAIFRQFNTITVKQQTNWTMYHAPSLHTWTISQHVT